MAKKKQHFITKEGLAKLKKELEYLKVEKAQEIAARLKEALSYGDLRENAEYQSAREEELLNDARIREIEEEIMSAELVEDHKKNTEQVELGSTVTIELDNEEKEKITFVLVGSTEVDPFENKFSNESPIGEATIGVKKGEKITYPSPSGMITAKIVSIN